MSRKLGYTSIWVFVVLILAAAPMMSRVHAISCLETITRLIPCQPYLLGMSNSVTVPCCQGAESLNQLVGSDRDQQKATCKCFKQTGDSMGVDPARAKQLPQLCKINVPVPIDPNTNCDSL